MKKETSEAKIHGNSTIKLTVRHICVFDVSADRPINKYIGPRSVGTLVAVLVRCCGTDSMTDRQTDRHQTDALRIQPWTRPA